jgi:hypothetical protein
MEDLNNIWNADDELNDDQLLNYIKGNSTGEDVHLVEKKMANSSFVNDGVEGLQQFSSTERINAYVQDLNEDLHHKLAGKKTKRKKGVQGLSWEIIALIVVILLCILCYVVIEMMR